MEVRREKNIDSLKNLQDNLIAYKKNIDTLPIVLQYNKRDLAEQGVPLLPVEVLEEDLNKELQAPSFSASAVQGTNVAETMKKIILMVMVSLQQELK